MINSLEAGNYYRLTDKESWLINKPMNPIFYDQHFVNDVVGLSKVDRDGDGFSGDNLVIDAETELEYFEEVIDTDVEDGPSFKVGDTAIFAEEPCTILSIHEENGKVLVQFEDGEIELLALSVIEHEKPSYKESFKLKFIELWKKQGIDFAYDVLKSRGSIDHILDIVYDNLDSLTEEE